jgi:hypothetical protein
MASQVQYRRGTNAQNAAFTGALAEITVDTTNGTLRVHDGVTAGGSNIATVSYVTAQIGSLSANSISDGTSSVAVIASGGNIRANVAGSTVQTISAGLVAITGDLSVTGNATLSGNILGDRIQNGTTTIDIQTPNGNANITVGGTSNVAVFTTGGVNIAGAISATGNITGGNLSGTSIVGTLTTAAQTNITSVGTLSALSVTGNVQGGNLRTAGLISATGQVTGSQFNGSGAGLTSIPNGALSNSSITVNGTAISLGGSGTVTANAATLTGTVLNATVVSSSLTSVGTLGSLTVTANVSGGNLITAGLVSTSSIVKTGSNAVGNIGSSSNYFNTVFAQATSALYADLAEKYVADAEYAPGTVVVFGGDKEVTVTSTDADRAVAGVVSTNPSYIMNGGLEAEHVATVALTGRVPCRVTGTIRKGDLMVSAGYGLARAEQDPRVGTVIGKALENFEGIEGVIEVVVGRF